jgi:hypothetical protein
MSKYFHALRCAVRLPASLPKRLALIFCFLLIASGAARAQTVKLAWDANAEPDLAGYKVYTGTASRAYGAPASLGKITSYSSPTLAPGTYYFAVTAYNSSGAESGFSNEVVTTVGSPGDTTPPVFSGITLTGVTTTAATVSWTTNEPSDTQVDYGTSSSCGTLTSLISSLTTSHSQQLTGLPAGTTYYYRVRSRDAAGNLALSATSTFVTTAASGDTTAPTVTMTAPASGSTVSGVVTVSASATDNVGVVGVQFLLNGSALGVEDTTAPYSISWSAASSSNGSYTLTARARDAAGNSKVSAAVTVTVQNTALLSGIVAGFPFSEGSGTSSADISGNANTAQLRGTTWGTGRFGSGLLFNGTSSYVTTGVNKIPAPNLPQTIAASFLVPAKPSSTQVMVRTSNTIASTDLNLGFRSSRLGVWNQANTWLVSAPLPSASVWHQVAYAFDGKIHWLYVDGVLAATSTVKPGNVPTSVVELGRGSRSSSYYRGSLDEVSFYNRALSSAEVSSLRTTALGKTATAPLTMLSLAAPEAGAVPTTAEDSLLVDAQESASVLSSLDEAVKPAAAPVPQVHFDLSKPSYISEEPVELTRFTVSNFGAADKAVELKTWVASPTGATASIGTTGEDGSYVVPAGASTEFGPVKVLDSIPATSGGSFRVGSRMLDPVTGDAFSEKQASFVVPSAVAGPPKSEPAEQEDVEVSAEVSAASYGSGDVISVSDLTIRNFGDSTAAVQVKLWLESHGMEPVSIMRAGGDGDMVVPEGSELHFYHPRDLTVTQQQPRGDYTLRCRILDPVTGAVIAEQSVPFRIQ